MRSISTVEVAPSIISCKSELIITTFKLDFLLEFLMKLMMLKAEFKVIAHMWFFFCYKTAKSKYLAEFGLTLVLG